MKNVESDWPWAAAVIVFIVMIGGCLAWDRHDQSVMEQEAIKAGLVQDGWGNWVKPK